jgi:hypothetical protein
VFRFLIFQDEAQRDEPSRKEDGARGGGSREACFGRICLQPPRNKRRLSTNPHQEDVQKVDGATTFCRLKQMMMQTFWAWMAAATIWESVNGDSGGRSRSEDEQDFSGSSLGLRLGSVFVGGRRRSQRLSLFEVSASYTNHLGLRRSARLGRRLTI